ncbi:MAG: Rieske (2Fe-2S) protein [Methylovirgula sp.]
MRDAPLAVSAAAYPDGAALHPAGSSGFPTETSNARRFLPASAYDALAFQRTEDASIWTRAWIGVGFAADVVNAGDILPYTAGNHGLHIERCADGALAGRFNKAQHGGCRSVPLQCQTGARTHCSFTACGFSYDRPVIKADDPERGRHLDQYLGLRPERLLPVSLREWGPLIVACLDPAAQAIVEWPECETVIPRDLKDGSGQTLWKEYAANWKHLAVAFADTRCEGESATILFPNVVIRKFQGDVCVIVLQPVALDRTLCRVRMMGRGAAMSLRQADRMSNALARCGALATKMQHAEDDCWGDDDCLAPVRTIVERKIRDAIESLEAEERTEALFRTSDRGGW